MEANIWEMVSRRMFSKETGSNNVWNIFKYFLVVCDVFLEIFRIQDIFTEVEMFVNFSFALRFGENFLKS